MSLGYYKIYSIDSAAGFKIPFIVSDDLYDTSFLTIDSYVSTDDLDYGLEYVNNISEFNELFNNFPALIYTGFPNDAQKFINLYTKRQDTNFLGETTVGLINQTFEFSTSGTTLTVLHYRNSTGAANRTFPSSYVEFRYSSAVNFFAVEIPVVPLNSISNGTLELKSIPHTLSIELIYSFTKQQFSYTLETDAAGKYSSWNTNNGAVVNEYKFAMPINFYANPVDYDANNGETVTPNFVLVYDDGSTVEPFTNVTYDESRYFKDTISTLDEDGISITIAQDNTIKRLDYIVRPNVESEVNLYAPFHIDVLDAKNPYFPDGDSTTGGGGGGYGSGESYFGTSGLIPNGTVEENDSVGSMYTRYAMNLTELNTIGNYFWSEDLGLQVAKTIISLLYGDPVQTIISCVSYPFNIASLTGISGRVLRWGGHDTGLTMQALNSNGFQIDWGTITVNEYWGNFLDYSPFTKFQLYLPWGTGFVDIDPNDVMRAKGGIGTTAGGSGTLSVKTNVEVSRGMCVHHVIANNTVIGSYSGSCGRQIPITGSDYASKQVAIAGAAIGTMVAGAVTAGAGYMSGTANATREFITAPSATGFGSPAVQQTRRVFNREAASQTVSAVGSRAIRPAIASAAALAVSPPHVSRSGSFQEGTGSLTIQSPYLIISRPKMSMPANYGNLYGYPSNIYLNLGSLSGYTEVGSIHLDGIPATMEELSEIDDLLKGGVIL